MNAMTMTAARSRNTVTSVALKSWGMYITRALAALFGRRACWVAAVLLMAALWWHNATIADRVAAGEAVALDCLAALPWAVAAAWRATISAISDTTINNERAAQ